MNMPYCQCVSNFIHFSKVMSLRWMSAYKNNKVMVIISNSNQLFAFHCKFFLAGAPFFKLFLYFFEIINIIEVEIRNFKVLDNFFLPVSLFSQILTVVN